MAAEVMNAIRRKPNAVDEAIAGVLRQRRAKTQAHYNALVATQPNSTQRAKSPALSNSDNHAMRKDPVLYYAIDEYVKKHKLYSEDACRFHMITDDDLDRAQRQEWGTVFRVMMEEPINIIANEIAAYRIPVNPATGAGRFKWMVVRNYTCYVLHTQLGLQHTIYVRSF